MSVIKSRFLDLDAAERMLDGNDDLDELSAVDVIRVMVRRHARVASMNTGEARRISLEHATRLAMATATAPWRNTTMCELP